MHIHIASINGTPTWSGSASEKECFEKQFKQWFQVQEEMATEGFTPVPMWSCSSIPFGTTWEMFSWVEIECEGVMSEE